MNPKTSDQISLISSRYKSNKIFYEVQKEGVIFLRRLKNKKFRIIFNVIPLKSSFPESQINIVSLFNQNLFKNSDNYLQAKVQSSQNHQKVGQKQSSLNSYLTISKKYKQISQNRTIVVFNAYLNQQQPPKLVIFGYLIASTIFYHNWKNQFSSQSFLTWLFCQFGHMLQKTDIDNLNQNIKFKTGYNKTPYFLCLLGKDQQDKDANNAFQNYLNDFYRFQSQKQNSKINCALQTIIDYFPERSSLGIQVKYVHKALSLQQDGIRQVLQLGTQFETNILGRQLFNFEFTGTTIENLSFEMCEYFNGEQPMNLVHIYNKVILNKKSRVSDQCLNLYLILVQKQIFLGRKIDLDDVSFMSSKSILPISQLQLSRVLTRIREQTTKQAQMQALNCMNLQEYLRTESNLLQRIHQYQQKLHLLNKQQGSKFVNECFQVLDIKQFQFWQQAGTGGSDVDSLSQLITQVLALLLNKLEAFSNQCSSLFTQTDNNSTCYNNSFLRLITTYFQKLSDKLSHKFNQIDIGKRNDKLEIQTLKYQLRREKTQKKRLQQQYQLQLMMQQQLKNKVKEVMRNGDSTFSDTMSFKKTQSTLYVNSRQFYRMKRQIQELEQQVKDKNNHIQQLVQILEKFQSTSKMTSGLNSLDKKGDKFNQQTQQLIDEANQKIMKFYQIFDQIRNVEKQYEGVKKSLVKQRQKMVIQRSQWARQVISIKQKNLLVRAQNQKLQQIIVEQKKAIERFKQLKETLKQNIDQLQTNAGHLNCALAQTEAELQVYIKALNLVVQHSTKGKSQNLLKFYKFLQHKQLKELIRPLIGKK